MSNHCTSLWTRDRRRGSNTPRNANNYRQLTCCWRGQRGATPPVVGAMRRARTRDVTEGLAATSTTPSRRLSQAANVEEIVSSQPESLLFIPRDIVFIYRSKSVEQFFLCCAFIEWYLKLCFIRFYVSDVQHIVKQLISEVLSCVYHKLDLNISSCYNSSRSRGHLLRLQDVIVWSRS